MVGMVAMRQDGMTLDDLISTWRAGMTGVLCFLVISCGYLACAASSSGTQTAPGSDVDTVTECCKAYTMRLNNIQATVVAGLLAGSEVHRQRPLIVALDISITQHRAHRMFYTVV